MLQQLTFCSHISAMHYCESMHLIRHHIKHTCPFTIYHQMDSATLIKQCKFTYISGLHPDAEIFDAGSRYYCSDKIQITACSLPIQKLCHL